MNHTIKGTVLVGGGCDDDECVIWMIDDEMQIVIPKYIQ